MRQRHRQFYHAFPIQLLLLHLRSNLLLLSLWVSLLLLMSGSLGKRLGFQYLFLDPEYLGQVNFLSFYIVGLALGGFFMSWNLTTYLLTAQYFPFLASLARPFTKFSINNLLLPLAFSLFYLILTGYFQYQFQQESIVTVFWHLLALVLGSLTLIFGYSLYFNFTNRDIFYYQNRFAQPPNQVGLSIMPGRRKVDLDYIKLDRNRLKVWTYLGENLRPRLVRSVAHYESRLLLNIFKQNHLNALALQLLSMMLLLILGYLIDWEIFRIPAAASIIIMFSLLIAFVGALTYWFAEWRAFVIIILLVSINYITSFGMFNHPNQAYGLNYEQAPVSYNYEKLHDICFSNQVDKDKNATIRILNNRIQQTGSTKPKIVFLCASGGGLKAATWSMHVLQKADSLSRGKLLDQTVLMTGASGGMLGMAYLRELYQRATPSTINEIYQQQYIDKISLDLLNSIAFTIVSNDLFLPWSRFKYGNQYYFKDRGYIFEEQFNENTEGVLDRPLAAFQLPESRGDIPLLYLSPAIVNDGRQMIISPQGVTFMMMPPVMRAEQRDAYEVDAVDFRWLFADHEADSLRFLTALRMNATFPYVLPTVHLPSTPGISLVDAGFRDNYGVQTASRFIQVFKDWIKTNTSGVIMVQISSQEKMKQIETQGPTGIVESLFNPLGIAGKTLDMQEFQHDHTLSLIQNILGPGQFELIRFLYRPEDEKKLEASVSFHLTEQEKSDVIKALEIDYNQNNMERLLKALKD